MKEQFVTYEIALKLKELGFDEDCLAIYDYTKHLIMLFQTGEDYSINYACYVEEDTDVLAPLWQQVIDWFREEHDIVIETTRQEYFDTYEDSYAYQATCKVYKNKELNRTIVVRDNKNNHIFYSYPEIREQAILKAIELCQNKK